MIYALYNIIYYTTTPQCALLLSKSTIIRYMSHKLLTPINSAVLGLKLICDDIEAFQDPRLNEVGETARDISKSILSVVELLENLKRVDKVLSDSLTLQKRDMPIVPFLEDCFHTLSLHARKCGVDLRMYTGPQDINEGMYRYIHAYLHMLSSISV